MALSGVARDDVATLTPVDRVPWDGLSILATAVLWLDAALSEITTEGEPT